jgi:hypothetical protein
MKKVALSALAAAMISGVASADALTLYSDPKTGQVYTTPGEGRVEMGDFVSAKEVDMQLRDMESKDSEYQEKMKKYVNVKSKAKTLEFSGTHYLGFTTARPDVTNGTVANSSGFEMRRNYVQVKGYFNDKDYVRVTLDATKELASSADATGSQTVPAGGGSVSYSTTSQNSGYASVFIKYAYLWLDEVLPYTGVEAGIAHRPWIDYEEHNGWMYRSINKVALEHKTTATEHGPDLINSADFGINFKTKTELFSSEVGIFNGEGYHADKNGANQKNQQKLSLEWRLTGHLIGSGDKVGKYDRTKESYAQVSTYGMISHDHKDDKSALEQTTSGSTSNILKVEYDRSIYGVHAVYNQPEFLIAAQYFMATDEMRDPTDFTSGTQYKEQAYKGYSINAEVRPMQDWTVLARYDVNDIEAEAVGGVKTKVQDSKQFIYGVAYKHNKNVTFIASGKNISDDVVAQAGAEKDVYMLTTEIKW